MASPSVTPSGSSSLHTSEEHSPHNLIDSRKRKRMISNRESARRSRMRKQKHMDDLTAQVTNLRAENNHILTNINLATHLYWNMESENSVLRAQISELNNRLQALNDIINCLSLKDNIAPGFEIEGYGDYYDQMMIGGVDDDILTSWSLVHVNQPIMASSDVFMAAVAFGAAEKLKGDIKI
ncbi:hypothetical protein DH2020_040603 [Rehmannia glutinosa]|uniref:BZIP domain-containing protein n=1 Tax=Rehmannia glutinosa TaxID=99300 RepID=A0ABR0UTP7_REHGL